MTTDGLPIYYIARGGTIKDFIADLDKKHLI